jgi:hypothetical protein
MQLARGDRNLRKIIFIYIFLHTNCVNIRTVGQLQLPFHLQISAKYGAGDLRRTSTKEFAFFSYQSGERS